MTVEEILQSGRYTDRRGRTWHAGDRRVTWFHVDSLSTNSTEQMRLLIERDMHRDVCEGLKSCEEHPVAHVYLDTDWGPREWIAHGSHLSDDCTGRPTQREAFGVAHALAVSSD